MCLETRSLRAVGPPWSQSNETNSSCVSRAALGPTVTTIQGKNPRCPAPLKTGRKQQDFCFTYQAIFYREEVISACSRRLYHLVLRRISVHS